MLLKNNKEIIFVLFLDNIVFKSKLCIFMFVLTGSIYSLLFSHLAPSFLSFTLLCFLFLLLFPQFLSFCWIFFFLCLFLASLFLSFFLFSELLFSELSSIDFTTSEISIAEFNNISKHAWICLVSCSPLVREIVYAVHF